MPACTSTHRFAQTWLQQTVRDSPPRCANYEGLSLQGFHTITELHPVAALLSQQWIIICLTLLHFPHSHKVWLCEKRHNLETRNLLIIGHIDPPSLLFFFFCSGDYWNKFGVIIWYRFYWLCLCPFCLLIPFLWMQYLYREFLHIWHKSPLDLNDNLIGFWLSKVNISVTFYSAKNVWGYGMSVINTCFF